MRIAYFLNFYPTASQVVAENEMLALRARGHEIFVFAVWGQQADDSRIPEPLKGRVYRIETHLSANLAPGILKEILKGPVRSLTFLLRARKHIGLTFSLISLHTARVLHSLGVERIHAHFASTNAIRGMLLAELIGVPFSCTGHGSDLLLYPLPSLPEIIRRSNPFITISHYNRTLLLRKYGEVARKVKVIHCGVDLSQFKTNRKRRGPAPAVLCVTWLRRAKGVGYLIEAVGILKKRNMEFKCKIVGGGSLADEIKAKIKEMNLDSVVELTGPLPHKEVIALYEDADLFVLPSVSEGIPVALMEAMAMEVPVVATKITGVPELVDDGENGFLVEARHPEALADSIEKALRDSDLARKMGRLGRKKVEQQFDLETTARSLETIFLEGKV